MNKIDEFESKLEEQAIEEINQMIDSESWSLSPSLNCLGWDFVHDSLVVATGETQLTALKNTLVVLRSDKQESYEIVDHPKHYGGPKAKHEAISVIEEWNLGFHLGNVVKYISRAGRKPDQSMVDDLKKAKWYLERFIEKVDKNT